MGSDCVLGIDGGGTKTDAILMDSSGAVVGWGRAGPTHRGFEPEDVTSRAVLEAVKRAGVGTGDVVAYAVLSFCGAESLAPLVKSGVIGACHSVGETEPIFAMHNREHGLVIIASTGSCVQARGPHRKPVHLGGYGPIIGDEGSAYDIGVRAMRACVYADWDPENTTSLRERVLEATGSRYPYELVSFYNWRGTTRREIASLAPVVDAEARAGDRIASDILGLAARDLARLGVYALRRAGMLDAPYALIPSGSVATKSGIYRSALIEAIRAEALRIEPVPPAPTPALGCALMALKDIAGNVDAETVARAWESAERATPNTG